MTYKNGDKVQRLERYEGAIEGIVSRETIDTLEKCDYTGEVSQVQDGLVYVGFRAGDVWLTQVFKPEEIKEVK